MSSSSVITTSVFILTSESQDFQGKNILRFYGRSAELGPVEIQIQNSKPLFFISRDSKFLPSLISATRQPSPLRNFKMKELDVLYFATYRDFRAGMDALREKGIQTYESDVRPEERYLMERFICGQAEIKGEPHTQNSLTTFINPKMTTKEIRPEFRVVSLDIETGVSSQTLYSIAVHQKGLGPEEKRVFMLASKTEEDGFVHNFSSEKELLQNFILWIEQSDPDLLIGWSLVDFDLNFLQKRAKALGIPFKLGRGGRDAFIKPRESGGYFAFIPGRVAIDGPQTLRASFYSFEDYRLETVAQELLGTGKLITPDQDKIREIENLFRTDKKRLADYNLQDAVLVTQIFEKTGLIDLLVRRIQISGLLFSQVGLSAAAFDHFFLPRLHRHGFGALNVSDIEYSQSATGGHVLDPIPGIHEHVLAFDFKSLYPSVMRTFKIDPLSRLRSSEHTILTPNGFKFSKTEHILPDFIRDLLAKRAEAKKNKDTHLSQAIKILMNSFYGVMGSPGCRFYHPDLPNAITGTGRWLLLESKKYLETQGYAVVYGDTDSLFVQIKQREALDPQKLGEELANELNQYWKKRIHAEFDTESFLELEFEKYYKKFLLPQARVKEGGAKKRYSGLYVAEGKEVLEFIGMEFVRSDWTKLAKEFQYELYERVFKEQDVRVWIKKIIRDLKQGKLNDKLVYSKRLNKDVKEYTKSTPPHVKAARLLKKQPRSISYMMTRRGPIPLELPHSDIDYDHYLEKQIRPIAEAVLGFLGESFDSLIEKPQLELF